MSALAAAGIAAGVGALGTLGSIGGNVASSALNWYYTKKAAKLKYEYDQKYALNTPSWNKTGYERAGLNPMLSMGNANSAAQSGMNVNPSKADIDIAGGMMSGASTAASVMQAIKENEKKDVEIDQLKEQTRLTKATADIESQKAEGGFGTQQGYEIAARVQHLTESANLSREQAMKTIAESDNIRASLESIKLGNEFLKMKMTGQDISNSRSSIQLEKDVMDIEAFRTALNDDPNLLSDAIAGQYGAQAKESALTLSKIFKNLGEGGESIFKLISPGKLADLLGSILKAPGKLLKK